MESSVHLGHMYTIDFRINNGTMIYLAQGRSEA
jgi:hypothetical protein